MTHRAGIIGCGRVGCGFDEDPRRTGINTHAGAYRATPGVDLVALADLDRAKVDYCGDKFGITARYTDAQVMLARERLDIVSICTWADSHRVLLEAAVEAGVRAVFCEKPIADTLADAAAMVERCETGGVLLLVNHKRRFDPGYQTLAAYLREGHLGHIQQVTCYYTSGIGNTGVHLCDLLRWFFGDVTSVQARQSANGSGKPGDPNLDGWIEFDTGLRAAVQACDVRSYYLFEIAILGARGRLRLSSTSVDRLEYEAAAPSRSTSEYRELVRASLPVDLSGAQEFFLHGVRHLLACLNDGARPACGGREGRQALELVCALYASAEAGGAPMALPLHDTPVRLASR